MKRILIGQLLETTPKKKKNRIMIGYMVPIKSKKR